MNPWSAVVVASTPVDGRPPLGDFQMGRALSEFRRVLYVEPPLFLHAARREPRSVRQSTGVREIHTNLHALRPVSLPGANRAWGARVGDAIIGAQVRAAVQRLALPPPLALLVFDPRRGTLSAVPRDVTLYWRRDQHAAGLSARSGHHLEAREHTLLRQADLVTAVSPELTADARSAGAHHVTYVPNACDFERFADSNVRPKAEAPSSPVVGYMGGINWRVDLELIAAVADARPNWSIVLIGEVVDAPPRRANIHVMGQRPYESLPSWARSFQVGIVPYKVNRFNTSSFPLKVFEYLAAGAPVVSTTLPALTDLHPFVRQADDQKGFVQQVEEALRQGPDGTSCRDLASQNSWRARADTIDQLISARLGTETT